MKRKNGFFTFCCALVPGAGQMYLGYMKRGLSLMLIFALTAGIALSYVFEIIAAVLPVIWFYAFFDTFNLKNKLELENEQITDDYLFHFPDSDNTEWKHIMKKRHRFIGAALIFIGGYTILDRILMKWLWQISCIFPENVQNIIHTVTRSIPTLAVSIAIIYLGVRLIKGAPTAHEISDDYTEYKGDNDNE